MKRRNFIKKTTLGTLGVSSILGCENQSKIIVKPIYPRIISGEALHGGSAAGSGPRCLIAKRGSGGVIAMLPAGRIRTALS